MNRFGAVLSSLIIDDKRNGFAKHDDDVIDDDKG